MVRQRCPPWTLTLLKRLARADSISIRFADGGPEVIETTTEGLRLGSNCKQHRALTCSRERRGPTGASYW